MTDYSYSFELQDQARIFRFFATFSRWECALKRGEFARRGSYGQAEANWNAFADRVAEKLEYLESQDFVAGRDYLLTSPPRRLMFHDGWQPNPRRSDETDARYLFRVIGDVRNNLFHGGKYGNVIMSDPARDRALIDHSTAVLNACDGFEQTVRDVLEEAA